MITLTDKDDPGFIALASTLLDSIILNDRPAEVYVIRIDGWFDAKWLNFSGKVLGALGVSRRKITIPPFHPHRVLGESHFSSAPGSGRFVSTPAPPLHIEQASAQNLTRSISKVSQSAVFFWYSSHSLGFDRGSTMLYSTAEDEAFSWYASFHKFPNWHLERHRGISPIELQQILKCPA